MKLRRFIAPTLLVLLALATWPFVEHSITRAIDALSGDPKARGRLFHDGALLANVAIFAHMVTGALITLTVPLQVLPFLRHRAPRLHHLSGYVLASAATLTGVLGLTYIGLQGTVGGPWMSGWFALYGILMILAATMTVTHARARRFDVHRRWALRLLVLAVGSYLYRVHYGLWYGLVGPVATNSEFTGLFDRIQVWAFYLPYLFFLELFFWIERRRATTQATALEQSPTT